jgi:hypothetical protein
MLARLPDDPNSLDINTIIQLQNYIDNVFRLVVFTYALCMAVIGITNGHALVWVVSTLIIFTSLAYAAYVLCTTGQLLMRVNGYSPVNTWFYYIQTSLMLLLYVATVYYFYYRTDKKKKTI